MQILSKLKDMSPDELKALERNAQRLADSGDGKRKADAQAVLDAVAEERGRRGLSDGRLVVGRRYSRKEIGEIVGGSTITFIPVVDGEATCVCLDPALNPEAPNVVLAGEGPQRVSNAETLARQTGKVPVFLKRGDADWEYVGDYRVTGSSSDREVVAMHAAKAGRDEVRLVVFLAP